MGREIFEEERRSRKGHESCSKTRRAHHDTAIIWEIVRGGGENGTENGGVGNLVAAESCVLKEEEVVVWEGEFSIRLHPSVFLFFFFASSSSSSPPPILLPSLVSSLKDGLRAARLLL